MSLNVSAYSIRNPLVAILLFTLLTLGGIYGFMQMKVQQFPDIDFPGVITTVTLQGASPSQLENDVAKKIENKIASIEGVKHIRTTVQTGAVTVATEFVLEKDIQEAVDDVRSAVSEVKGDLPAAANDPIISKVTTAGLPVVTYTVSADNVSVADLSWFVDDTITKRLSDIKGVSSVSRVGGLERQVTVGVDPATLNATRLPITQLSQQITGIQQDASGGQTEVGGDTQTIRVLGAVQNARELADVQVALPSGGSQTLGSMATITDGTADPSSIAKLDGETVVAFNVTRSRGASEVEVVEAVEAQIAQLATEMPNYHIEKVFDRATPIDADYQASLRMLIEGGILAVVVVFLFLRDFRATIVAAVALPLSVIPSFLGMYLLGFSLNIISLLALSLVIGVLVDDAIVEVENIMRHLRMGKTPYQAAMEAADEIGLAVVATTFTLIAVFLPTAFMSGIVGQFFSQFGWTAAIAIFVSLMVARLITPMMAAYVLKPDSGHDSSKIGRVMHVYLKTVAWTLRHRWLTLGVTLVLFVGSLSLAKLLPTAFIPENDIDQSRIGITLTPDASLEDTEAVTAAVRDKVLAVDGVSSVLAAIGDPQAASLDSSTNQSGSENAASLDIVLDPRGTRPSKTEIEATLTEVVKDVPGARFDVGLSSSGESGYSFSLTSSNPELLQQTADQVMNEIRTLAIAGDVTSNKSLPRQELSILPDRMAMADQGVTTSGIADTLRVATSGDYEQALSKLNLDTRQVPIVVRLPDDAKDNVSQLGDLYVPSTGNDSTGVRVNEVAELDFGTGPSVVNRFNRERAIKISVMPEGSELGDLVQAVKALPSMQSLPAGITVIDEGQAENMAELFTGFLVAMTVGIICIFGVLILLFGKILQPFTILMALPLSIGGAFVGLVLTGSSLSMPSMIGFIMLMGIATKNSILLVDYAIIAENEHGLSRFDALLDACRKRAQPIIMTTIAMGAGMLPLVFGWGGADPTFRQPMAAAVLGGLVTSTSLSLIVIPMVYTLMDDLSNFLRRLAGRGEKSVAHETKRA